MNERQGKIATLLSVNVGLPREVAWRGQTVRTAIWKAPVHGKRMMRRLNIDGDAQGDLANHGGENRTVYVYQLDSYRYWQRELHRADFTFGHTRTKSSTQTFRRRQKVRQMISFCNT